MKKYFYHDIVDLSWIDEGLDALELSKEEKKELKEMAHAQLHQTILDAVLSELNERDKRIFLANLHYDTSEKTWHHLNENIEKVEDKIIKVSEDLKKELKADLADAKAKH